MSFHQPVFLSYYFADDFEAVGILPKRALRLQHSALRVESPLADQVIEPEVRGLNEFQAQPSHYLGVRVRLPYGDATVLMREFSPATLNGVVTAHYPLIQQSLSHYAFQ